MLSLPLLLAFAGLSFAQPAPLKTYRDADYGLKLEYPAGVFHDDSQISEEGFKTFEVVGKSSAEFTATIEPEEYDDKAFHWNSKDCPKGVGDPSRITAVEDGKDWCAVSLFDKDASGGTISYVKTIHSPGKAASLTIWYGEKNKAKYDKLKVQLAGSFSFYTAEFHHELTEEEAEALIRGLPEVRALAAELKKDGAAPAVKNEGPGEGVGAAPHDFFYVFSVAEDHGGHAATRYRFEVVTWTRQVRVREESCRKSYPIEAWRTARERRAALPEAERAKFDVCGALERAVRP